MTTTMYFDEMQTLTFGGKPSNRCPDELMERYAGLVQSQRFSWTEHHHLARELGKGGQGVVYLTMRRGADQFTLPVALKIFSPERYEDTTSYDMAMGRIAKVAAQVAMIQQDNLLDVHNFVDRNRIRVMEMEWIDGYDLQKLMTPAMLERTRHRVSVRRWEYLNNVIVTAGSVQPRLKPGVAVAIIRDCLGALAALHREGIVHGDIKPSNIMLKRTGNAKIVDIGSAFEMDDAPPVRTCTPAFTAPEVLEGGECSPQSDLASLGYVLIEWLSGRPPFAGITRFDDLLEAKRLLAQRLPTMLPDEVVRNDLLMSFCRGLVSPDPAKRFMSAEAAELQKETSAASFHRQLILGDMASEYDNEIRLWLEELD